MKKTYIDECLERAERATPGPWKNDCGNGQVETEQWRIEICDRAGNYQRRAEAISMFGSFLEDTTVPDDVEKLLEYDNEDDMDFIANARTDVPELARRLKIACRAMRTAGTLFGDDSLLSWADELEQ